MESNCKELSMEACEKDPTLSSLCGLKLAGLGYYLIKAIAEHYTGYSSSVIHLIRASNYEKAEELLIKRYEKEFTLTEIEDLTIEEE